MATLPPDLEMRPNVWPFYHIQCTARMNWRWSSQAWRSLELGPRGRILAPSTQPEGFGLSFRAPRHSNGPAIATKMVGANIGSTGDDTPLRGTKNLRTSAFPTQYFKIRTHTPYVALLNTTVYEKIITMYQVNSKMNTDLWNTDNPYKTEINLSLIYVQGPVAHHEAKQGFRNLPLIGPSGKGSPLISCKLQELLP